MVRRGLLFGVSLWAALAATAYPCAPAPPAGYRASVLAEQALIVWDPQARLEHFIRRASFSTDAPDFGFLVPTPARPELAEAPDAVFDQVNSAIQPEIVRSRTWRLEPTLLLFYPFLRMRSGGPLDTAHTVRVLEEKRIAGYDATVVEANDASALLRWLGAHGYDARPELREWLKPYVERRWTITAFKVAPPAGETRVGTQAVRMSFACERPFFPYREPADQRQGESPARELWVYLVAPQRLDGTVGADRPWNRELLYAAPRQDVGTLLAAALLPSATPGGSWLHAFRDRSSPRPGVDDLFFGPAASAEPVLPPPQPYVTVERIPLPLEPVLVLGAVWWWRRRRRGTA
jgi:hypothetical protein